MNIAVLACNANEIRILPARYVGSAANSRCFINGDFENQKSITLPNQTVGWIERNSVIGLTGGRRRLRRNLQVHDCPSRKFLRT